MQYNVFGVEPQQEEEIKRLNLSCLKRMFVNKLKASLLLDKGFSSMEVGDILLLEDDVWVPGIRTVAE